MATNERFDELISGWLAETAQPQLPDRVLAATFERTRQTRQHVGWRAILRRLLGARPAMALAGAAIVVMAVALALGSYFDRPAVGGPSPSADPRSPFLGTWVSTSDADGGTQTMTITSSTGGAVGIVVTDDIASVCSGTPSTMTGTGRIEGGTQLVIPSPTYTCDDGREAVALSGPPLQEQLRNLTFVRDVGAEILRDGGGGVWLREVQATVSPRATATPSATVAPSASGSRFDSTIHGISIDVPSGSQIRPATEPWTGGPLAYDSPAADVISFPGLGDRAYLVVASQPLGQLSEDAWRDEALAWLCSGSGSSFWGVKADGYRGMAFACPTTTSVALIPADGRGYLLRLVVSSDEAGLAGVYDGWFTEALKTVDLRPIDAVDAP